jgi:hypothetical protein
LTLLETIQESAVDASADLSTVLRQCRLLAARLDSRPLEEWLVCESEGYPSAAQVPSYRVWPIEVRGHFSGYFQSMAKNYPVPSVLLPANVRDDYANWKCRMSVAALEATLAETKGTVHVNTNDLALVLGENVLDGYNCISAWGEFSSLCLVEVLNAVRNRVLEFVLAVWKEAPDAGEIAGHAASSLASERATQIFFNTVVRGGSVSLVGAVEASTVTFNVVAGDWTSLERVLLDSGLTHEDLQDLRAALEADPVPKDSSSLGPRVSAWIAAATKKAASGVWTVGLSAAGSLLAKSIAQFYGLQ